MNSKKHHSTDWKAAVRKDIVCFKEIDSRCDLPKSYLCGRRNLSRFERLDPHHHREKTDEVGANLRKTTWKISQAEYQKV
jgi:hypothetical protein